MKMNWKSKTLLATGCAYNVVMLPISIPVGLAYAAMCLPNAIIMAGIGLIEIDADQKRAKQS